MGRKVYEKATELLITADAGGSNAYRSRVFKTELQKLADRTGLTIGGSHFPPGTSKWNKIEHRMFCHITENWRGQPLIDCETVVQLIVQDQDMGRRSSDAPRLCRSSPVVAGHLPGTATLATRDRIQGTSATGS